MKEIPTDFYTFTEIGGVGEMVNKAVEFPEYVPEYNHATKEDEIKPLFTFFGRPTSGTDYSLTGHDLLASLCNLYKRMNAHDSAESATDLVTELCKLGTAFEYYDVLQKVRIEHDVSSGRNLYYEGKIFDSLPFLEKYR